MGIHHSRDQGRGGARDGASRRGASDRTSFLNELFGSTGGQPGKPDHKTAMLCRQVQRMLSLVLGGELDDPQLSGLVVGEVTPAPNAGHLLVELIVPTDFELSMPQLLARIDVLAPRIRHLVAQAISRKRAPSLSFIPVAGGAS